jgi:hypothetical protein
LLDRTALMKFRGPQALNDKLPVTRTNRELMQESTAGTGFTIRLDKAFMKSSGRARADDARSRLCTQKPVIS